jgi:glycerophosphoryl diester phosphodiesterase
VEIIAHRGASFDAPENTLAAFRLGFEQGADAAELDVHLTQDGSIVVLHDFTTHRIGGNDKAIREQALADLKRFDAGAWKDPKWAGEKIPTLEEVLAILPDGKRLFIEIKCGAEILPELNRVLKRAAKKPEQTALIGFGYDTLQRARTWFPHLQIYWLFAFKPEHKNPSGVHIGAELIEKSIAAGFGGLNLLFNGPINAEFMQKARDAKQQVYVWTIDDPDTAQRMINMGVDGISTNRPGWMRTQLEELPANHAK